jgi:hypothetical protein
MEGGRGTKKGCEEEVGMRNCKSKSEGKRRSREQSQLSHLLIPSSYIFPSLPIWPLLVYEREITAQKGMRRRGQKDRRVGMPFYVLKT